MKSTNDKNFKNVSGINPVNHIFPAAKFSILPLLMKILSKLCPANSRRRHLLGKIYRLLIGNPDKIRNFDLYRTWIINNEPSQNELAEQRQEIEHWSLLQRPCISIVTPIYQTPLKILREMIESVISQTYPVWKLCLANGSPDIPEIQAVLNEYTEKDARIKVLSLEENRGIAGNTNAAISIANGEFVGFLDHDDLLAPFALYSVVKTINENPECDLLYSDRDKISKDGQNRFDPFFKPAFSPEYIRVINYLCHFFVIRKTLGDQIGWIRDNFEGAQDFDLVLRSIEKSRFIAHIPQILYHWRAIPGSTADSLEAKEYASEAGIKAVREHLQRSGLAAEVVPGSVPAMYRPIYSIDGNDRVSIIIPSRDQADDLQKLISSIVNQSTYHNYEILIVENHSIEEKTFALYKTLKRYQNIRILTYSEAFNFSKINNFAVNFASGNVFLFMNNDMEVITPDWLERMLAYAIRPETRIVGAKLYYPNDTIQHAGVIIGYGGIAGHAFHMVQRDAPGYYQMLQTARNVSAVTGACLMMRKKIFEAIHGFDENYRLAFGDVDICLKSLQAGYLNIWTPFAELYHYESKTRGYEDSPEKIRRFHSEIWKFRERWWHFLLKGDDYYNPNLRLEGTSYEIDPAVHSLFPGYQKDYFVRPDREKLGKEKKITHIV